MLPMLKWSMATVKVKALGPMATPWAEIVGPWDLISAIRFRNINIIIRLKKTSLQVSFLFNVYLRNY
jgi:hypothetical protein